MFASDPNEDQLIFKWVIQKEVINRSQGGARETEPEEILSQNVPGNTGEFKFKAPLEKGEYRLFSYVFDGNNKAGTANVPFYVE